MTNLIGAAYKWRINNNVYSYITNAEGGDPFISSGSTVCNEELIRSKVQNFTEGEYETKFNEMVTIVHEKYPYVQFLDYTIYMNEVEHCDIYNRPDVVTDIDIAVCSTTLPSDSGATVEITSTDEDDIECRDGEKIRKYRIHFGIPKGSSLIPIDVTDEELSENGDQIIKDYGILAGDSVISVDSTTIWRCDENNNFINTGVKLNKSAYRYSKDKNAYSFGENDTANGVNSITEGYGTKTNGEASHAEGYGTETIGEASHAEGYETKAYGNYSHAEGKGNEAHGEGSHAEGCGNFAYAPYSTVIGKYAEIDGAQKRLFQVGYGTGPDVNERRDFFAVNNDGTFIFSNSGETKTLSLSDFGRETVKFQDSLVLDPKYDYKNGDLIFNEDETDKNLYLLKSIEEDEDKKEDGLYLSISKDEDNLTFEAINLTKNDEIEELNKNIDDLYEQIDNVTATPQFIVGTIVMWPSSYAPCNWLLCDGKEIPNEDGEGEELIKILYPDYKEGDGGVYNTPDYSDLFPDKDNIKFIIYAGVNMKKAVESIYGVTYDMGDNYTDNHYYPNFYDTSPNLTNELLTTKTSPYFAIWVEGNYEPLVSVDVSESDESITTYDLTFELTGDTITELIGGKKLLCGFVPYVPLDAYTYQTDYCVKINIEEQELYDMVDKELTFNISTRYYLGDGEDVTVSHDPASYMFAINSFVKQICN